MNKWKRTYVTSAGFATRLHPCFLKDYTENEIFTPWWKLNYCTSTAFSVLTWSVIPFLLFLLHKKMALWQYRTVSQLMCCLFDIVCVSYLCLSQLKKSKPILSKHLVSRYVFIMSSILQAVDFLNSVIAGSWGIFWLIM